METLPMLSGTYSVPRCNSIIYPTDNLESGGAGWKATPFLRAPVGRPRFSPFRRLRFPVGPEQLPELSAPARAATAAHERRPRPVGMLGWEAQGFRPDSRHASQLRVIRVCGAVAGAVLLGCGAPHDP